MEKYEKLFKGLEMCAGPDCSPECPYHGETRGGKTCRAWLLNDAATALALEMGSKPEVDGLLAAYTASVNERGVLEERLKFAEGNVAYWHGRSDAMASIIRARLDMFPNASENADGEADDDV